MRRFRKALGTVLAGGAGLVASQQAGAATTDTSGYTYTNTPYYVDNNAATQGGAAANAGAQLTWNSNAAIWDPTEDGTGTPVAWSLSPSLLNPSNPDIVLGAGYSTTSNPTNAVSANLLSSAYNVIISSNFQTEGIYIKDGSPTLVSGTTVGSRSVGADGITLEATAKSVNFLTGNAVNGGAWPLYVAANQTWTNNNTAATGTFTVSVPIGAAKNTSGGAAGITGTTSTLTLTNNNTASTAANNTFAVYGVIGDNATGGVGPGNPVSTGGLLSLVVNSAAGTYVTLAPRTGYNIPNNQNPVAPGVAAINTYSGGTLIAGGILDATEDNALGTGNVTVAPGGSVAAMLQLDTIGGLAGTQSLALMDNGATLASAFLNYTGTDAINTLTYNGAGLAPGIYGAIGNGLGAIPESFLTGTGTLTVSAGPVPEPASISIIGLGALGLLRRRRRQ